jgi:DNA-binding NtrC family response regulator
MFRDVKVLIAVGDDKIRGDLALHIEGLSFTVATVPDVRTVLQVTENYDLLMLDTDVANGNALIVLDRWVTRAKRPCLVMMHQIDPAERISYMQHGAWNIIEIPEDRLVLANILVRYGLIILETRKLDRLEQQVKKLNRLVTIFALLAVGLAGERAIEIIRFGLGLIK